MSSYYAQPSYYNSPVSAAALGYSLRAVFNFLLLIMSYYNWFYIISLQLVIHGGQYAPKAFCWGENNVLDSPRRLGFVARCCTGILQGVVSSSLESTRSAMVTLFALLLVEICKCCIWTHLEPIMPPHVLDIFLEQSSEDKVLPEHHSSVCVTM